MITKDERATVAIIREPSMAIGVVEAEFKGERRVLICLMSRDKDGKVTVDAPLAMLLEDGDFSQIKNSEGVAPGTPKIEIVRG